MLRGGYGLYFDQYNTARRAATSPRQNRRPLNALATLTNTAIGVGQLATYRFGIDPLPPQPTRGQHAAARLRRASGSGPNITDPRDAPGAHRLRARAGGQHDAVGRLHARRGAQRSRQLNINPIVNGRACWRRTSCASSAVPNVLNRINVNVVDQQVRATTR